MQGSDGDWGLLDDELAGFDPPGGHEAAADVLPPGHSKRKAPFSIKRPGVNILHATIAQHWTYRVLP